MMDATGDTLGETGTTAILRAALGNEAMNSVMQAAQDGPSTSALMRAAYGNSGTNAILRAAFGDLPQYVIGPAIEAVREVQALQRAKVVQPGLYYLVLTDLVGSTAASAKLGVKANVQRIERFIKLTQQALGRRSSGHFLKEIGDASLFLFSSFADVLKWYANLLRRIDSYNGRIVGKHVRTRRLATKVIVHLGEVIFAKNQNPVAFAVNQIFKIEKAFSSGHLGCTDLVRRTLIPRVSAGELLARPVARVTLPGESERSTLWRLIVKEPARGGV